MIFFEIPWRASSTRCISFDAWQAPPASRIMLFNEKSLMVKTFGVYSHVKLRFMPVFPISGLSLIKDSLRVW